MSVADVSEATWDSVVLGADRPVLVDVWADWCIPCRRVEPMLVDADARYGDRLRLVRLDADASPNLVARHEIMTMPTLLLYDGGELVGRISGVPRRDQLPELIETIVTPGD